MRFITTRPFHFSAMIIRWGYKVYGQYSTSTSYDPLLWIYLRWQVHLLSEWMKNFTRLNGLCVYIIFIYRIFDYSIIKNINNDIYYLLHFYFLRIHSIWIELCCASWYTSQTKANSLQAFTFQYTHICMDSIPD